MKATPDDDRHVDDVRSRQELSERQDLVELELGEPLALVDQHPTRKRQHATEPRDAHLHERAEELASRHLQRRRGFGDRHPADFTRSSRALGLSERRQVPRSRAAIASGQWRAAGQPRRGDVRKKWAYACSRTSMNPMAADSASPLSVLLQVLRDGLVDVPVGFGKLLARPVPTALSLDCVCGECRT